MTCSIPNCTQSRWLRGTNTDNLCRMHLRRKVKFGDPLRTSRPVAPRNAATCKDEHCPAEAITRGYCGAHYKKFLRTGVIKRKRGYTKPAPIPTQAELRRELVEQHLENPVTQAINWSVI